LGQELRGTFTPNTREDVRSKTQLVQSKGWISEPRPRSGSRPIHSQTSLLHVPRWQHRPSHQILPHLPGDKEEHGSRLQKHFTTVCTQRSQPNHALEPPSPAIQSILPFDFSTSLPNQSSSTSGILSVLPLRYNQPPTTSTSSVDNIPHQLRK
jgi:hypothetical protein